MFPGDLQTIVPPYLAHCDDHPVVESLWGSKIAQEVFTHAEEVGRADLIQIEWREESKKNSEISEISHDISHQLVLVAIHRLLRVLHLLCMRSLQLLDLLHRLPSSLHPPTHFAPHNLLPLCVIVTLRQLFPLLHLPLNAQVLHQRVLKQHARVQIGPAEVQEILAPSPEGQESAVAGTQPREENADPDDSVEEAVVGGHKLLQPCRSGRLISVEDLRKGRRVERGRWRRESEPYHILASHGLEDDNRGAGDRFGRLRGRKGDERVRDQILDRDQPSVEGRRVNLDGVGAERRVDPALTAQRGGHEEAEGGHGEEPGLEDDVADVLDPREASCDRLGHTRTGQSEGEDLLLGDVVASGVKEKGSRDEVAGRLAEALGRFVDGTEVEVVAAWGERTRQRRALEGASGGGRVPHASHGGGDALGLSGRTDLVRLPLPEADGRGVWRRNREVGVDTAKAGGVEGRDLFGEQVARGNVEVEAARAQAAEPGVDEGAEDGERVGSKVDGEVLRVLIHRASPDATGEATEVLDDHLREDEICRDDDDDVAVVVDVLDVARPAVDYFDRRACRAGQRLQLNEGVLQVGELDLERADLVVPGLGKDGGVSGEEAEIALVELKSDAGGGVEVELRLERAEQVYLLLPDSQDDECGGDEEEREEELQVVCVVRRPHV
eukprot:746425-Hanusia_phi.AAC.6